MFNEDFYPSNERAYDILTSPVSRKGSWYYSTI